MEISAGQALAPALPITCCRQRQQVRCGCNQHAVAPCRRPLLHVPQLSCAAAAGLYRDAAAGLEEPRLQAVAGASPLGVAILGLQLLLVGSGPQLQQLALRAVRVAPDGCCS
jgi:hypothetical protein